MLNNKEVEIQAPVSNAQVEDCLREILQKEGYSLTPQKKHGQTGVDIIATRDDEAYHIEAIGYKKAGSVRAKDFYEAFFRIVSRLNDGAVHCILALSCLAEIGLPARAKQHRVAWRRISDAFPELEIWLVDTDNRLYRRTSWGQWIEEA
ncbi:MAG: restriction endonuclease [Chloroflexi bacterium]|nr:restriction endonuclease [Chloroflexota bacterium]